MWKEKFVYALNYLKTLKTVHKSNPRTHSPQQNKKAVLTTATHFNFSNPVRLQRQLLFVYLRLPKRVFPEKNWKSEHHHLLLSIFEFQLKLTILIFWIEFDWKGCFQSKAEKVNTTIEFCMFELVQLINFSLSWQFLFFHQICTKRVFSV